MLRCEKRVEEIGEVIWPVKMRSTLLQIPKLVALVCLHCFYGVVSDDDLGETELLVTMIQGYPCGLWVMDTLSDDSLTLTTAFAAECDNLCMQTENCKSFTWSRQVEIIE